MTTGDDAIELAYTARNTALGNGIGVNLRVAEYSGVNSSLLETVRLTLHNLAKKWDASLIPAPIDHLFYEGYAEPDSATIEKLIKGYNHTSDGGRSLDTPLKVIEQIGQCRVVVTGSYHAGVFALSQGIPAIGLAKSEYYADKFLGLAEQFGVGCEVIFLDDRELQRKLVDSIDRAWQSAEQLRPQLLEAARRQVELGHTAYKRVYELVNSR
jgi:colanic acid/amylovoran biosynthesis protein